MPGRKVGQIRESERVARANAFRGARIALAEGIAAKDAAERVGVNRSTLQEAMLVLRYGTAEEIAATEHGDASLRKMRDTVGSRTDVAARRAAQRPAAITRNVKAEREVEAEIWAKLRSALDALTSLPVPTDVVTVVRRNAMRADACDRMLLNAHNWLEDFINAYTVR